MSARLTTHELEVLIAASSPAPQTLSSLIGHQFIGGIVPSRLALTVTVAPATSAVIVDDLDKIATISPDPFAPSDLAEAFAKAGSRMGTNGIPPAPINHTIELVLNRDSSLDYRVKATTASAATATAPVIKTITVRLADTGAQANVRYDCYGTNGKTFTIKTLQDHQAPHTTSSVVIRGVFDGHANLNTHNTIRIHKDAQHANATQSNKNILLSKDARVVTTPQLEIEAHDVKCKHGAAVSRLNPEQLFYLQARGIDTIASRDLLIQAFLV